ncbi:MAG: hypothetical protein HY671_10400 [Chloroflexi bacterium]|nr:hypothetical protein [Chloroflexota bacterium]
MQDRAHVLKARCGRRIFLGILGAGELALVFGRRVASRVGQRPFSGETGDRPKWYNNEVTAETTRRKNE